VKQMVFICGCSRSGTTTFVDLLNTHEKIAIGRERYGKRLRIHKRLTPDLFEKARFLQDYHPDDGHQKKLLPLYATLEKRYDACTHIGDKIPNLFLPMPKTLSKNGMKACKP